MPGLWLPLQGIGLYSRYLDSALLGAGSLGSLLAFRSMPYCNSYPWRALARCGFWTGGAENLDIQVQAAAITFLARFYLRHSPLEHDIKDTMLACLYLAGKVSLGAPLEPCKSCSTEQLVRGLVCQLWDRLLSNRC